METQKRKPETREEYERARAERTQQRLEKRRQAIEEAKRVLKEDDCPIKILRAKHVLQEEEIAERIDAARNELQEVRKQHRVEMRELRRKENGTLRRARREPDESFVNETKELIRKIIGEYLKEDQQSLLDWYEKNQSGEKKKEPISYQQIADSLNEQNHKTAYGRKWERTSVKRFIERHLRDYLYVIGLEEHDTRPAVSGKRKKVEEHAIYMRDEVLPTIDTNQKYHIIAAELNKRGIKTRLEGKWGNMSVKRLLETIEKLDE